MSHKIPEYLNYISSITIVDGGSGYNSAVPPTITISGGGGSGATATASVLNGEVHTVNITNIGRDYTSLPTITVTDGGGSGAVLSAVLGFASSSASEYEEKSALNVKFSLPEFIQTDYNKFISFIEKYFEYMDEDNNPINLLLNKKYTDIDDLNDAELNQRANELAASFPQLIETDRKLLLKRIKSIYESKGSERSIKAYFKLLYNEEVDVYYPSKNILRASDGVWIKETSVRALVGYDDYEVLNLNGRVADIKYFETTGSVTLTKTIPITIPRVEKIAKTFPQTYEVVIDLPPGITDVPGPGTQATVTATVSGGFITGFTVTNGGYDYIVAPTVNIYDSNGGYGAQARAVVSDGEITRVVLVPGDYVNKVTLTSGGTGYISAPTVVFDAPPGDGITATATATISLGTVTGITITNPGSGYTSTPNISFEGGLGDFGAVAATAIASREGGTGYTSSSSVSVTLDSSDYRTVIVERGESAATANVRAYLDRTLFSVTSSAYIGDDAGFSVGDVFFINETGADGGAYAVSGYFLEDYTYFGGANNAVIRVAAVDEYNVPIAWTIINPGEGFINSRITIPIESKTGKSLNIDLSTKYLYSYDGKYKDDRGKLSDVNRIQDNYKFQSYSYIIKSAVSQEKWVKRFKELMHPAGMQVFGDLIISHNVNFAPFISIISDGLHLHEFKTEDIVVSNDDTISIVVQWVRGFSETQSVNDTNSLQTGKNVLEIVSASDDYSQEYVEDDYLPLNYTGFGISKYVEKVLTDTLITTDVLEKVIDFRQTFTESSSVNESNVKTLQKVFAESRNAIDAFNYVLGIEHVLTDTIYIDDAELFSVSKALTDSLTISDLLEKVIDFRQTFIETSLVDESNVKTLQKVFAESGNAIDTFNYVLGIEHLLSDTVHIDDAELFSIDLNREFIDDDATHSEFVSINTEKGLVEAQAASESSVKTLQKPFIETGNTTDSGVITIQGYSDPTYFSEDYVGAGYNF
jgi:hypothetical protein